MKISWEIGEIERRREGENEQKTEGGQAWEEKKDR
jgi:hypothetical protein